MKPVNNKRDVEIEIRRAILIMKFLPSEGPQKLRSSWPDFPAEDLETDDEWGYFKPLPEEIDDMYEVFENWFRVLNYQERLLVYHRNAGWSWKKLLPKFRLSRSALFEKYNKCLLKMLDYAIKSANSADKHR